MREITQLQTINFVTYDNPQLSLQNETTLIISLLHNILKRYCYHKIFIYYYTVILNA